MPLPDSFLDPESLQRSVESEDVSSRNEDSTEFELWFFGEILKRNPNFVDVLRCHGELLSRKRRHAEAVLVDERLVRLCPDDGIVRYNLACSLALVNRPHEAIEQLRLAFEHGYTDFAHLVIDHDLDSLRGMPSFRALIREHGISN